MHAMKPILPAVLALCTVFATTAVAAMKIMPLGDSITEGLCSDGSYTNTASLTTTWGTRTVAARRHQATAPTKDTAISSPNSSTIARSAILRMPA